METTTRDFKQKSKKKALYYDPQQEITIIKPTLENLSEVLSVENSAWPDIGKGMVANSKKFENRLEIGGMLLLYLKNNPVGIISYQYPSFANSGNIEDLWNEHKNGGDLLDWENISPKYHLPRDWYHATNDGYIFKGSCSTHDPRSDCVFLIGVGVDNNLKGQGLVNLLISQVLVEASSLEKKYVLGYGRLPQLHEAHPTTPPSLKQVKKHLLLHQMGTDLPFDYGARFHVRNGAEEIAVIPHAMDDPESWDYGFLALYKL